MADNPPFDNRSKPVFDQFTTCLFVLTARPKDGLLAKAMAFVCLSVLYVLKVVMATIYYFAYLKLYDLCMTPR